MSHLTGYEQLRLVVYVVGLPIVAWLIVRMIRQVRAIRDLDARLREEEERNASNPYYRMSRVYEARELLQKAKGGGRPPRPTDDPPEDAGR